MTKSDDLHVLNVSIRTWSVVFFIAVSLHIFYSVFRSLSALGRRHLADSNGGQKQNEFGFFAFSFKNMIYSAMLFFYSSYTPCSTFLKFRNGQVDAFAFLYWFLDSCFDCTGESMPG